MGSQQPPIKIKGGLKDNHDVFEPGGLGRDDHHGHEVGRPPGKAKIRQGPLLVFYDLEWSFSDIIQIGASCGRGDFSQAVRPSGKVNYAVKKKIKMDVKVGPTGKRQVFDVKRRMFLPTLDPRDAFMDFLDWLEEIGEGKEVVLVSHGSEDILVLDRNLARYDLQTRLYSLISHLVDFQEYLTNHFTDMKGRAGLDMLVNCYLKGSQYRLHCADDDARALEAVCRAVHSVRGITEADYAMDMLRQPKMSRIKSVVVPKNCRDIRELAWSLNPGSNFVLLPGIHGVYNTLVASSLFNLIEPPDNFQFEVLFLSRHSPSDNILYDLRLEDMWCHT